MMFYGVDRLMSCSEKGEWLWPRNGIISSSIAAGWSAGSAPAASAWWQGRLWSVAQRRKPGVGQIAIRSASASRPAPDPLSANPATPGGMTGGDVLVAYEIAGDEAMRDIVRRGVADAEAAYGWSVHADVSGLQPGRPYWYRFRCGDAVSRVGRAMTAPAAGAPVER